MTTAGALLLAAPAQATFHLLKVNEVSLSQGGNPGAQFVELSDPNNEPFPAIFGPFRLIAYDAAGSPVGSPQTLNTSPGYANTPRLLANQAVLGTTPDEALSVTLPAGSGQLCFVHGNDNAVVDCVGWGTVTTAVQAGEPVGPAPPDGQSLQRCGTTVLVGAPTPKAANSCSGGGGSGGGGGGGGTVDRTAPRASVAVAAPRLGKLISKGLGFRVRSNEPGRASATLELLATTARKPPVVGSASVKIRRAGSVTLRVRLTRSAKRRLGTVGRARLRLRVTVTDQAGNRRKLTKTLTSRR